MTAFSPCRFPRVSPFAAAQGENAVMLPVHLVYSKEQGRAPIPGG